MIFIIIYYVIKLYRILNCFKLHKKILIDNISIEKIFTNPTISNFDNLKKDNNWYVNYYKNTLFIKILFPTQVFESVIFDGNSDNLRLYNNIKFEKKYNENLNSEKYKILKKGNPYYITHGKFSGQFEKYVLVCIR